jgi:rfaE bifunctional protein nucleotidyltransferase chain/domain/rfaE bifunctional protein kinase chain/domain
VVIGDVLLDREIEGRCERLCPDAPAPVVDQSSSTRRPGGAGLAALLARRHVDDVTVITLLADDDGAGEIREMFDHAGVAVVAAVVSGLTPEKIRISAQDRPLLRLDRGGLSGCRAPLPSAFVASARRAIEYADAVLVADYGQRGVDVLLDAVGGAIDEVPVVWDPHPKGAVPRRGVAVVTPSQAEAAAACGGASSAVGPRPAGRRRTDGDVMMAIEHSETLVRRWGVGSVATTCGAAGAVLVRDESSPLVVPSPHVHTVVDTCGAGDAFASATAAALACGAVLSEAIGQAVRIASAFVGEGGARGVRLDDGPGGRDALPGFDRILTPAGAAQRSNVVVAAGGCFDILHAGHVQMLEQARLLGDRLVVLVNSDDSVRRLKGPRRPVNTAHDRAAVLRALTCVDEVVIFDDDTPHALLRHLRPQLFVKGGDYAGELGESSVMKEWGGAVVTLPYLAGRSTTGILRA